MGVEWVDAAAGMPHRVPRRSALAQQPSGEGKRRTSRPANAGDQVIRENPAEANSLIIVTIYHAINTDEKLTHKETTKCDMPQNRSENCRAKLILNTWPKIGYENPLSCLNAIALFFARWPCPRASKCRRR